MARKTLRRIYVCKITHEDLVIYLASSAKGAVRVYLRMKEDADAATFFKRTLTNAEIVVSHQKNESLIDAVHYALQGKEDPHPGIPLDIHCTPFQWEVYRAISRIPFGHTWTYKQVAEAVHRPGAARAVGQAMGANPLPLIFP